MSEQITGEQLEAVSGQWKSIPVCCEECGWSGDSEDLVSVIAYVSGRGRSVVEVCPVCGGEDVEGG